MTRHHKKVFFTNFTLFCTIHYKTHFLSILIFELCHIEINILLLESKIWFVHKIQPSIKIIFPKYIILIKKKSPNYTKTNQYVTKTALKVLNHDCLPCTTLLIQEHLRETIKVLNFNISKPPVQRFFGHNRTFDLSHLDLQTNLKIISLF